MTYQADILASSPLRYWPMNEASGTVVNELIANEDGVASGLTMGGAAAPTGIGGVAPVFTGTEHLKLRTTGALLGGLAAWTVGAWVYYAGTDSTARCFFGEMGAAGNDQIQGRLANGSSTQMSHVYGDDGGLITLTAPSVFIQNAWAYIVLTRTGASAEFWWNAGQRTTGTTRASSTWTNAGVQAWAGMTPRSTNPFIGRIAHLAVWDRVLTQSEIESHFQSGTPRTRLIANREWFKEDKAIWRQALDDPTNVPTIASNSATLVTRLVNQVAAFPAATSDGGGPLWIVDNTTPTQRVRIDGGINNVSFNRPDLWNAFGHVPIPAAMVVGPATDLEVQIYNSDSDELWEFWVMRHELLKPDNWTATISGFGVLPASSPVYMVAPATSDGKVGTRTQGLAVTVNGSQGVRLTWGITESATNATVDHFNVYRASAGGQPKLKIAEVPVDPDGFHTFTDTGFAQTAENYDTTTQVVTTDWGCSYGGYINGTDDSIGVYEPPHQNWGASATSLPLWGGSVSLDEGLARDIPHALTMALAQTSNSHVYPAQRHDYFGGANEIPEGTRFQLDPAFNTATISNLFARAIAVAFQKYGGYVRDHSSATTGAYVEDQRGSGRDHYPQMYSGKHSYEVLTGFPWSSMRVIDPAWTLAETLPPPIPIEALVDNFDNGVIDAAVWASSSNASESGGRLRISYAGGSYGGVTSVGGGAGVPPFTLLLSRASLHPTQVGTGLGDQAFLRVASQIDLVKCRTDFVVTDGNLTATYTTPGNVTVNVAATPYIAATHAWWRISESGGVISFDTSPNGWSWTSFASYVWSSTGWPSANLANVVTQIVFGNYNGTLGRPDFVVDDLNLTPTGAPPIDLPTPLTLKPRVTTLSLDPNLTQVVLDG